MRGLCKPTNRVPYQVSRSLLHVAVCHPLLSLCLCVTLATRTDPQLRRRRYIAANSAGGRTGSVRSNNYRSMWRGGGAATPISLTYMCVWRGVKLSVLGGMGMDRVLPLPLPCCVALCGCAGCLFGLVRHPGAATAVAAARAKRLCGAVRCVVSQRLLPGGGPHK